MLRTGKGHGELWRLSGETYSLELVTSVRASGSGRPPILFIHGVEFEGPDEVMKDLVMPMLSILGQRHTMDREIYLFSWNSLITNHKRLSAVLDCSFMERVKIAATELPKCRSYLSDIERRAKEAARILLPFAVEWSAENRTGPTVITHSMGGLVWAETIKILAEASSMLSKPGIWWSLQPALPRSALSDGGDYEIIPRIYCGGESSKALIWYSRMDLILSSIYLLAKGSFALGQRGCPRKSVTQRDITRWALEAHGMLHVSGRMGDFFKRVSRILASEADALRL